MKRPSDLAISFEAIKTHLKQDRDGFSLSLKIHPDDIPEELIRSWVGSRYMVAMTLLDESDQPVAGKAGKVIDNPPPLPHARPETHHPSVALAGQLCRDAGFQRWCGEPDESHTADALKRWLAISSRSELASDKAAAERLDEIVERYREDCGFTADPFSGMGH